MSNPNSIHDDVKLYYGKTLHKTNDLKTNACCSRKMPQYITQILQLIHTDVASSYYGCGIAIPLGVKGCKVLDLGSGSGRDCYVMSKLVGEDGHVTGIDMTDEQVQLSRKYIDYHTKIFGFSKANIDFKNGYIEALGDAGIVKEEYDIIISNCVINLSPNKKTVVSEAFNALKVGGEMYFSDVYCDKDLPQDIRDNKLLWGECLAGALTSNDIVELSKLLGFSKPRLVSAKTITIDNKEIEELVAVYKFASATYRLIKLPKDALYLPCNAIYKGTIEHSKDVFKLDYATIFKVGDVVSVDSEVAAILKASRYREHFTFQDIDDVQKANNISHRHCTDVFDRCDKKLTIHP